MCGIHEIFLCDEHIEYKQFTVDWTKYLFIENLFYYGTSIKNHILCDLNPYI